MQLSKVCQSGIRHPASFQFLLTPPFPLHLKSFLRHPRILFWQSELISKSLIFSNFLEGFLEKYLVCFRPKINSFSSLDNASFDEFLSGFLVNSYNLCHYKNFWYFTRNYLWILKYLRITLPHFKTRTQIFLDKIEVYLTKNKGIFFQWKR